MTGAPINDLPIELLLMTFDHFRPQSHSRLEYKAVLILTSVCTNWRRIIQGTPGFWTYVTLNPRRSIISSYLSWLLLQLHRAGTELLHVRWYIIGEAHPDLASIIENLAPLNRWRTLYVYITNPDIQFTANENMNTGHSNLSIPQLSGELENLEEMTLYGDAECPPQLVELVERTALKLQRLRLEEYYATLFRTGLSMTLKRVKELVLT